MLASVQEALRCVDIETAFSMTSNRLVSGKFQRGTVSIVELVQRTSIIKSYMNKNSYTSELKGKRASISLM